MMKTIPQRLDDMIFGASIPVSMKYRHRDGSSDDRVLDVYALGKFQNSYFIIAYSHDVNARCAYKIANHKNYSDLRTGEKITKMKDFVLAFNPTIVDLTYEFNMQDQERMQRGDF